MEGGGGGGREGGKGEEGEKGGEGEEGNDNIRRFHCGKVTPPLTVYSMRQAETEQMEKIIVDPEGGEEERSEG